MLYRLCLFLVYFLLPKDAFAWGPGAHMTYALFAISQAVTVAPAIRLLLKKYPKVFLYGTIAADIILAKKFAGDLYHCHHWNVALPLLDQAKTERERAFLYGYLGHLAVDTVAHNYYVPYKTIASYRSLTLRHTYWEMRFDEKMDAEVWRRLEEVAGEDFQELDDFLAQNLKRTIFSFKTNKKIFNSLMLLTRMQKWRRASTLLSARSEYPLPQREVEHFRQLCFEVLLEFLQDPTQARVLRADPSGNLKLRYAKDMVVDLRRYTKRGLLNHRQAQNLVENIRVSLEQTIYAPGDLPLITDALNEG